MYEGTLKDFTVNKTGNQRTVITLSVKANTMAKARGLEKSMSLSKHIEELIWKDAKESGLADRFLLDGKDEKEENSDD